MSFFTKIFGGNKTFKPLKPQKGEKQKELSEYARTTLGSGNMRLAVLLPKGEELFEWLAVNTVDFFNEISLLYGTITEYCTAASCPIMSAGPKFEYLWADQVKIKKPIRCSAPEYNDYLFSWVENQLSDETIFPLQLGTPFPKHFPKVVSQIFRRLFRVYAHIYHSHFEEIRKLGAEAHLNTCYKHFIFFVLEYKLIEMKELEPLKDLTDGLISKDSDALPAAAAGGGGGTG
jgi:MOB kinase activator 1